MRLALGAFVSAGCTAVLLSFSACGSDETGTQAEDAAPEAEVDASVPDTAPDVVEDVVEADRSPVQTFCGVLSDSPHPPRFCDDFDDHDATNAWTASAISGGGPPTTSVLAEDPNTYVSAPLSVTMATKALALNAGAGVLLRETLLTSVSHPIFQFQARFSQTVFTAGSVEVARLNVTLDDHFFDLYLYDPSATPPGPALAETANGTTIHHPLTGSPTANTWQNIVMDIDLTAGTANVSIGGTPVLVNQTIATGVGTEATIRIGAAYMLGPLPDFIANFDNVVLDF